MVLHRLSFIAVILLCAMPSRAQSCSEITGAKCKEFVHILRAARHRREAVPYTPGELQSGKVASDSRIGAQYTGGLGSGQAGYTTMRFPLVGSSEKCEIIGKRDPLARLQGLNLSFHGKRVLDLGCNAGGMLMPNAWSVREGIGVDFDEALVSAATQISNSLACNRLHFHKFDLLRWPLDQILDKQKSCDRCGWDIITMYSLTSWLPNWRDVIGWAIRHSRVVVIEVNSKSKKIPSTGEPSAEVQKLLQASCAHVDDPTQALVALGEDKDRWTLVCTVAATALPRERQHLANRVRDAKKGDRRHGHVESHPRRVDSKSELLPTNLGGRCSPTSGHNAIEVEARKHQVEAKAVDVSELFRWYTAQLDMHSTKAVYQPPRTWTVLSPAHLQSWSPLGKGHGSEKQVMQATLRTEDHGKVPVVIKSCIPGAEFLIAPDPNSPSRAARIASAMVEYGVSASREMALAESLKLTPSHECNLHETMFFERLRGQPGIPELLGGWFNGSRFYYVTMNHGNRLCDYVEPDVRRPGVPHRQIFQQRPVKAAQALLRCFQSFAELGDYYLMDFNCKQFTVAVEHPNPNPVVYLVDAPLQRQGLGSASAMDADAWIHLRPFHPCTQDDECQHQSSWIVPHFNKTFDSPGRCRKHAGSGSGCCQLDLASYSSKTHVVDVAQHNWLMPFLLDKVPVKIRDGLQQIIGTMLRPAHLRPSFSSILESVHRLSCAHSTDQAATS